MENFKVLEGFRLAIEHFTGSYLDKNVWEKWDTLVQKSDTGLTAAEKVELERALQQLTLTAKVHARMHGQKKAAHEYERRLMSVLLARVEQQPQQWPVISEEQAAQEEGEDIYG